jgi:heterodisulfide reductase subunit A
MSDKKKVVIIGGGLAGMESSSYLYSMGYDVTLIEKQEKLGGHVANWDRLFPSKRPANEVISFVNQGISKNIDVRTATSVLSVDRNGLRFNVKTSDDKPVTADAILLATGYDTFDAHKKEEYGYGIYDNVITSTDLEQLFLLQKPIRTKNGNTPKRVAFVHCVGSRDEKVGNINCSKVCCVTAVKQAIEVKEAIPGVEVFNLYMDLRMFELKFEDLYKEAQQKGVNFIRGRLSEASENQDGSLVIKTEDTLTGRPMKITVDLLVLMVGFAPAKGSAEIAKMLNINLSKTGYIDTQDEHTANNATSVSGVFVAGTASAPHTITETLTDARAASLKVASYLQNLSVEKRSILAQNE